MEELVFGIDDIGGDRTKYMKVRKDGTLTTNRRE